MVYYRQKSTSEEEYQSLTLPSSDNEVELDDLIGNTVYQFQVAAIVYVDGEITTGVKSAVVEALISCKSSIMLKIKCYIENVQKP